MRNGFATVQISSPVEPNSKTEDNLAHKMPFIHSNQPNCSKRTWERFPLQRSKSLGFLLKKCATSAAK